MPLLSKHFSTRKTLEGPKNLAEISYPINIRGPPVVSQIMYASLVLLLCSSLCHILCMRYVLNEEIQRVIRTVGNQVCADRHRETNEEFQWKLMTKDFAFFTARKMEPDKNLWSWQSCTHAHLHTPRAQNCITWDFTWRIRDRVLPRKKIVPLEFSVKSSWAAQELTISRVFIRCWKGWFSRLNTMDEYLSHPFGLSQPSNY